VIDDLRRDAAPRFERMEDSDADRVRRDGQAARRGVRRSGVDVACDRILARLRAGQGFGA
jgi:hypothetical protein